MSKKVIIIAALAILVVAGVSGYFIVLRAGKKTSSPEITTGQTTPNKATVTGDKAYQDASGFSFNYPKEVSLQDVTPDDNVYYSKLDLTKGDSKITISVFDGTEEVPQGGTLVGATTLGGLSAKEYSVNGNIITLASSQGVIYQIEGPKDGGFWEDTQNVISSSFSLGDKSASSSDDSGASDNAIYEPEEVVE